MRSLQRLMGGAAIVVASMQVASCSHAQKKPLGLSHLQGKKVALIEIDGEATARSVIEVALINQLVQRGDFEIVPKEEVNAARAAPEQDPSDWKGIARRAGADYALKARVLAFDADQREGYSKEQVYDSELAAERGKKEGFTERLFKVKSLTATVRVALDLAETDPQATASTLGVAEDQQTVTAEARTEAAHLPPRLRFLESVANQAFKKFFDQHR